MVQELKLTKQQKETIQNSGAVLFQTNKKK